MVTFSHYNGELLGLKDHLTQCAQAEGGQNRPPGDAVNMDPNESSVRADAETWIASEHQLFTSALTDASRFSHELQQRLPELDAKLQQLISSHSLQSEAIAEMAGERGPLAAAVEERMRLEV